MRVQLITDPADERIADYRALTDVELRTRWEPPHGLFIAEGELVLRRARCPATGLQSAAVAVVGGVVAGAALMMSSPSRRR